MANSNFQNLPAAIALTGAEIVPVDQSGTTKRTTTADIANVNQAALTVATLPSAASYTGVRRFVTDANATTFASIVAGGGSNKVPVYSDGTNWRIG